MVVGKWDGEVDEEEKEWKDGNEKTMKEKRGEEEEVLSHFQNCGTENLPEIA